MKKQNLRTKHTLSNMVANGGKRRSLAQAMREAGYSESYARNPQKIKKTLVWKEYLEQFIPDKNLFLIHTKLLDAQRISKMIFPACLTDEDIKNVISYGNRKIVLLHRYRNKVSVTFSEPDTSAQINALDLAYKIKGSYKKIETDKSRPYSHLSDTELSMLINKYTIISPK